MYCNVVALSCLVELIAVAPALEIAPARARPVRGGLSARVAAEPTRGGRQRRAYARSRGRRRTDVCGCSGVSLPACARACVCARAWPPVLVMHARARVRERARVRVRAWARAWVWARARMRARARERAVARARSLVRVRVRRCRASRPPRRTVRATPPHVLLQLRGGRHQRLYRPACRLPRSALSSRSCLRSYARCDAHRALHCAGGVPDCPCPQPPPKQCHSSFCHQTSTFQTQKKSFPISSEQRLSCVFYKCTASVSLVG
jgi:hypothetical protein